MHSADLLEQAISVAQKLGYGVRYEWLGGVSSGACEYAGRKWLFIDLALNVIEQLDQVTNVLRKDPAVHTLQVSQEMGNLLGLRRAA
jgi:hypothetical protein